MVKCARTTESMRRLVKREKKPEVRAESPKQMLILLSKRKQTKQMLILLSIMIMIMIMIMILIR